MDVDPDPRLNITNPRCGVFLVHLNHLPETTRAPNGTRCKHRLPSPLRDNQHNLQMQRKKCFDVLHQDLLQMIPQNEIDNIADQECWNHSWQCTANNKGSVITCNAVVLVLALVVKIGWSCKPCCDVVVCVSSTASRCRCWCHHSLERNITFLNIIVDSGMKWEYCCCCVCAHCWFMHVLLLVQTRLLIYILSLLPWCVLDNDMIV